jgi:hypothetical protein
MQERQIALQSEQDASLHKLEEYIILGGAWSRPGVVNQSSHARRQTGSYRQSVGGNLGGMLQFQISNFKSVISKIISTCCAFHPTCLPRSPS